MRYGLIGGRLGHSWSERIHHELGDYDYRLYELRPEELASFLQAGDLGGLNVTIPYKKTVIPFCSELSEAARAIGSVNTLCFTQHGIVGHNTDCDGFDELARRTGISFSGRKVLIFGTGGTSLTAAYCARRQGAAEVVTISRSGPDNYENLERHRDAQVLVNTTPVGMYPDNGSRLVHVSDFPQCCGVLDVVYNPLRSALILDALALGIPASGGLPMLVAQAAVASGLFFSRCVPAEQTERILRRLTADMENIVLIGMPGCGKSSVGALVARRTGRPFYDLDDMVVQAAGMSIPELFASGGEAAFRALECQAAAQAGSVGGAVIAAGGGTILNENNRRALAQNGRLYFLTRSLDSLATEGRPLSRDLPALYRERLPFYRSAADAVIGNDRDPEQTADEILEVHHEAACTQRPEH